MSADALDAFRGEFPRSTLTARRVAAVLEAPGCDRRAVLEAANVDIDKLARLITDRPGDRQSPFALTRGNSFEAQVTANGMAAIVGLVRQHLGLAIADVRQVDLSAGEVKQMFPGLGGAALNERRVLLTSRYLREMTADPDNAPNLIRHAMTKLNFGGETAYLEQDVLAFAIAGRIHVVEIKSFPRIDGRADPDKASAAIRQSAVYVLSLKEAVRDLGEDPALVDDRILVILPENLSFTPTALVFDSTMQVRRLRRRLASMPNAADVLTFLPPGISLPALPPKADIELRRHARVAAADAVSRIPNRLTEACTSCPLFRNCRDEADRHLSVSRLGSQASATLGGVTDIREALRLASGERTPASVAEVAVATALQRAAAARRYSFGALP